MACGECGVEIKFQFTFYLTHNTAVEQSLPILQGMYPLYLGKGSGLEGAKLNS